MHILGMNMFQSLNDVLSLTDPCHHLAHDVLVLANMTILDSPRTILFGTLLNKLNYLLIGQLYYRLGVVPFSPVVEEPRKPDGLLRDNLSHDSPLDVGLSDSSATRCVGSPHVGQDESFCSFDAEYDVWLLLH
jgi:hypothetical protein